MKTLPDSLAAHLAGRTTTIALCWIVVRNDAVRLGFTDHDRAIMVDGVLCEPQNGLTLSAVAHGPGLATGGADVTGSLSSPSLIEADLDAGLWDNAEVQMFLVNWRQPEDPALMQRARIGEVVRSDDVFRAELRGLAHLLEARRGRVFSRLCDADLGDDRCRVDLDAAGFQASGSVTETTNGAIHADGFGEFADHWFAQGRLQVLDGPFAGFAAAVASHRLEDGLARFTLVTAAPDNLGPGTGINVRAGCDKHFATCREKFSNQLNFQGFPHMPGSDFVLSYPGRNTGRNDGSARVL